MLVQVIKYFISQESTNIPFTHVVKFIGMKTSTKSLSFLISMVCICSFTILITSCGPSRSEYEKVQKENAILKDSLAKLSDRFINGKNYYDNIVQLIENRKYKDAQDSLIVYRLMYPDSKLFPKADSIEKIISSKTKEVMFNTSSVYKYSVAVYQSLRQYNGYNRATHNFELAAKGFQELQFKDEKDKKTVNDLLAALVKLIPEYDPNSMRFSVKNAIFNARLEEVGKSIKILEISNE